MGKSSGFMGFSWCKMGDVHELMKIFSSLAVLKSQAASGGDNAKSMCKAQAVFKTMTLADETIDDLDSFLF